MAPDQLTAGKSGKPHDHAAGLPPLGLSPEWSDWPLALSNLPAADFRMQRESTGPFQFGRWVCCHTPSGKGRTIPEKLFPTRNSEKLARVSIGWHDLCSPSSRLGQHHRATGATIHICESDCCRPVTLSDTRTNRGLTPNRLLRQRDHGGSQHALRMAIHDAEPVFLPVSDGHPVCRRAWLALRACHRVGRGNPGR
jgi:hypothetical protein